MNDGENLVILENYEVCDVISETYGNDINSILKGIIGVSDRNPAVAKPFDNFYLLLNDRQYDDAEKILDEIIRHLAVFISRLWQIHIFEEGNTRTTAVFFIKYLRTLGFPAANDIFAENAWYFRNALVRANYTNLQKGIYETTEYLELFLRNLLLDEKNELHNRTLHISGLLHDDKVDIEEEKVDIQDEKVNIESILAEKGKDFAVKTMVHIHRPFDKFGFDGIFGRSAVMELLELKSSGASKFLSNLVQADIIEPVSGYGKGKYKFKEVSVRKSVQ